MTIDYRDHLRTEAATPVVATPEDYEYYMRRGRRLRSKAFHTAAGFVAAALRRAVVDGIVEPLRRRRLERIRYRELSALDDRTLRDIGISRSDIPALASGRWDGPARPKRAASIELVVDNPPPAGASAGTGADAQRPAA